MGARQLTSGHSTIRVVVGVSRYMYMLACSTGLGTTCHYHGGGDHLYQWIVQPVGWVMAW